MKTILGHAPFIRIVCFVIVGIILQFYIQLNLIVSSSLFIVLLIVNSSMLFSKNHQLLFKYKYLFSTLLLILLLSFGVLIASIQNPFIQKKYYGHLLSEENNKCVFVVRINKELIKTKNGVRTSATVIAINKDSITYESLGKINLFFEDTATFSKIHFGDEVVIQSRINKIQEAMNPYEFDSKKFYTLKGIYFQSYVNSNSYNVIRHQQISVLTQYIYTIRNFISLKFEKHIQDEDAIGVCKALLLGVEEDLDAHLLKAYASSGVIHVLSVSGLHVGIFYIIINYLFSLIKIDSKKIKWIKAIVSLILVWFYALLSGFSPSVLRSAVMLTTVIIAATLDRKISIYNSLAASCFILLCFQSNYIFDVGFQLSYLAVLGIVALQSLIYDIYVFKNYWLDKIWNMIGVSVSAQAITFPLSVYYFYQFPLLFLFANLIVIPIISLSLPIGFVFMFACIFQSDLLLHYIAMPLEWTIIISNIIILGFDKIPFNTIKPVFFTAYQTWFLYVIFGCFFIAYFLKNAKWYIVSLSLTLILFLLFIVEKYQHLEQHNLMVYNIHNTQRIELVDGNQVAVITNQSDSAYYDLKIRPNHIHHQIKDRIYYYTTDKNVSFNWQDKHILILNKVVKDMQLLKDYDYIVVGNNAIDSSKLIGVLDEKKQFIFDSSNSLKNIQKINRLLNHQVHVTKIDKAYVLKINH